MKVIVILVLLAGFAESSFCQNGFGVKPTKHRYKISKTNRVIKTQMLKRDKEKSLVNKTVQQFVEGVFVDRNILETFRRFVSFESCDELDESSGVLSECLLKEIPAKLGNKINSKFSAITWLSEYQRYFLDIGIYPITKSELKYPYSAPDYEVLKVSKPNYDNLKSKVTRKTNSSSIISFNDLSKIEINKELDEQVEYFHEIEKLIFHQVDKKIYKTNIEIIKTNINVKKVKKENRVYFVVSIKSPDMGFILGIRNKKMKIIGLFDGV